MQNLAYIKKLVELGHCLDAQAILVDVLCVTDLERDQRDVVGQGLENFLGAFWSDIVLAYVEVDHGSMILDNSSKHLGSCILQMVLGEIDMYYIAIYSQNVSNLLSSIWSKRVLVEDQLAIYTELFAIVAETLCRPLTISIRELEHQSLKAINGALVCVLLLKTHVLIASIKYAKHLHKVN